MTVRKGWQELGRQGAIRRTASAGSGLDAEQLLTVGPALARTVRTTMQAVSRQRSVFVHAPPSSTLRKACTSRCAHLEGAFTRHRSHPAGLWEQGTPQQQAESGSATPLSITMGQHQSPLEWPRMLLPARLNQAARQLLL